MEEKVNYTEEILKQILCELQQLNKQVGGLEAGQKELFQLYSGLEEHTKVTRNMVVKLSEDVDELNGNVSKLEKDVDQLKTGQTRLENKLDEVKQDLEAKIDDQMEFFIDKMGKQEIEIFKLKKKVG